MSYFDDMEEYRAPRLKCTSKHDGRRCRLLAGHDGDHTDTKVTWEKKRRPGSGT